MAAPKAENELYKPAEACRIAEVAPYVLRYWETEFAALSEGRDRASARVYTARDVRIIARIRELLYDEGFTVAGAKKRLDAEIAEGRFDSGLAPAPPIATQRPAEKPKPVPAEKPAAATPAAPPKTERPASMERGAAAGGSPAAPGATAAQRVAAVPAPAAAGPTSKPADPGFDRKTVLRELKDIVRILGRP